MKSKALVILSTLVMALALMAQSATQTTPAPSGDTPKTCACCNHDQADSKKSCCGKDGGCCKDGKCAMMSKDGKDTVASHEHQMSGDDNSGMKCPMMSKDGKMSCCGKDCCGGKCDMAKDGKGKSCCDGMKCQRKQTT